MSSIVGSADLNGPQRSLVEFAESYGHRCDVVSTPRANYFRVAIAEYQGGEFIGYRIEHCETRRDVRLTLCG